MSREKREIRKHLRAVASCFERMEGSADRWLPFENSDNSIRSDLYKRLRNRAQQAVACLHRLRPHVFSVRGYSPREGLFICEPMTRQEHAETVME